MRDAMTTLAIFISSSRSSNRFDYMYSQDTRKEGTASVPFRGDLHDLVFHQKKV